LKKTKKLGTISIYPLGYIEEGDSMKASLLIIIITLTSLFLVGCGSESAITQIDIKELETILTEDYQFIDVRTAEEYDAGHIEAFNINLDYYQFKDDHDLLAELDKDKTIVVICRSGNRSNEAAKLLEELGFTNIYNVNQGITSWDGPLVY
jgi:rhodanese-related sulfurtransferase